MKDRKKPKAEEGEPKQAMPQSQEELLCIVEAIKRLDQFYRSNLEARNSKSGEAHLETAENHERDFRERAAEIQSHIEEFVQEPVCDLASKDFHNDTEISDIRTCLSCFQQRLLFNLQTAFKESDDPVTAQFPMLASRGTKPDWLPMDWSEAAWPKELSPIAVKQLLEWILLCYQNNDAQRKPAWREQAARDGNYRRTILNVRKLLLLITKENEQNYFLTLPPQEADFDFTKGWIDGAIALLSDSMTEKETSPSSENNEANYQFFKRADGLFQIKAFGEEGIIQSTKGMNVIWKLLSSQTGRVPMTVLLGLDQDKRISEDSHSIQPVIDPEAKRRVGEEYKKAIADLENAKKNGDHLEIEECQKNVDFLRDYLNSATGLAGKSRDLNTNTDKLRTRIYSQIKTAIKNLREIQCNKTAAHFETYISADWPDYCYSCELPKVIWQAESIEE